VKPMAPASQPRKRTAWIALGVLALVLLAGIATATAHNVERNRPQRALRELPALQAPASSNAEARDFTLELAGTAVGRQNQTFTIEISGSGKARTPPADADVQGLRGMAAIEVRLYDANGTLVGERALRAHVHVRATDEGIRWALSTKGPSDGRFAVLMLRGIAESTDAGYDLDGQGSAVGKASEERPRHVLKLDVSGSLTWA
jgi:hypothetical protein